MDSGAENDRTRLGGPPADGGRARTLPDSVGNYRILGRLGEGGMGTVFEAEQASPRRRVALKVIRGRFADDTQIRMFLREADALARLEHPNIGAIYESGRTPDGEHYFAMELVRGVTLDTYLRSRGDTIDDAELHLRLRLFSVIAGAVQYAHQRGVIHRDLKPGNILVVADTTSSGARSSGGDPVVKVLDFGLARLADAEGVTTQTDVGVIKGTLAYMSPEQARGTASDVDARSDVYALGVMLFEMLTGRRPYETGDKTLLEAVRVICEQPPAAMSTVWRGPARLDADIATIVGKAIEKDPARRYGTAAAMADDVERYRSSQPILARPPSAGYQLRRFARRHRGFVAAVATVLVVIVTGAGAATWQAFRAMRAEAEASRRADEATAATRIADERRIEAESARALADRRRTESEAATRIAEGARAAESRARTVAEAATGEALAARTSEASARRRADASAEEARAEAAKARAINEFLTTDLLASVMPSSEVGKGRDVVMREVLDEAARRIGDPALTGGRFEGQPLVEASIRLALGRTYRALGEVDRARPHLERALALREPAIGRQALDTLDVLSELANLASDLARDEEAERLMREVLAGRQALKAPALAIAKAQASLGTLLNTRKRHAEAEQLLRVAKATIDREPNTTPDLVFGVHNNLALVLMDTGRDAEALTVLEDARSALLKSVGPNSPASLIVAGNVALVYRRQGRLAEAETLMMELLPAARKVAGDTHPAVLGGMVNLGSTWNATGRQQQTIDALKDLLPTARQTLGSDHPTSVRLALVLGEAYFTVGQRDLSAPLVREAVAALERSGDLDTPDGFDARLLRARTMMAQGQSAAAIADLRRLIDAQERAPNVTPAGMAPVRVALGMALLNSGSASAAEPLFRAAIDALASADDGLVGPRFDAQQGLGLVRLRQGRVADAVQELTSAAAEATRRLGATHQQTLTLEAVLGNVLLTANRLTDAEPHLRTAYEGLKIVYGPSHPMTLGASFDLWNITRRTKPPAAMEAVEAEIFALLLPAAEHPKADLDTLARASIVLRLGTEKHRNPQRSLAFAERAAGVTRTPEVLMVLAEAQLVAGQRDAAIATIEQAIAAAPEGTYKKSLQGRLSEVRGKSSRMNNSLFVRRPTPAGATRGPTGPWVCPRLSC